MMAKHREIFIAQGYGIPPLNISGGVPIPSVNPGDAGWERKAQKRFDRQAKIIADALFSSLPGGTVHSLLVELLKRKTSLLVVK